MSSNDAVVINLPEFEGIIPAILAKFMGKKIIALYHCEVVLPHGFINSVTQSLLEVSNMATLGISDRVVTYTSDYAKGSKLLRHVRHKLTYIVPPVATPHVSATLATSLRRMIGKADVVIGISARLAAEKGMEYLFQALPLIQSKEKGKKVKVVVAGPMTPVGEGIYKEKILKMVKKYKQQVVFLGEIDPKQMGSFYSLLDVLVLPSVNRTEAFGLVQVEAMLCGVPVVASSLPGVRVPIMRTGMGILVSPKQSTEIASAITTILHNKNAYVLPKEKISQLFSEKTSIQEFTSLLTDASV
jgi:glycosyltransferase involved in cell wall biosynthesis